LSSAVSHIFTERKPKDLSEIAGLAEPCLDAHAGSKKEWPMKPVFIGHLSPTSERKFGRGGRSERIVIPETGESALIVARLVVWLEIVR